MLDAVKPPIGAPPTRRLVVLDVDSTFIQEEVVDLLAVHADAGPEVAAITERAMNGEIDFGTSLEQRVATLAGLPERVIAEVRTEITLTPGIPELCQAARAGNHELALVSGGFTQVIEPVAAELGITRVRANHLEVVAGELTGRILGEIVDRPGKAKALACFAEKCGIPISNTVAIGDGANDLDMLALAGLGIAFNAKAPLAEKADVNIVGPRIDSAIDIIGL